MSDRSQSWSTRSATRQAAILIVALLVIVGTLGCGDETDRDGGPSNEAGLVGLDGDTQKADAEPERSVDDALAAVADRDYARALQIAASIDAEETIGRAISDGIAARVTAAVGSGNRAGAGRLLRTADREGYPATDTLTGARAALRDANRRAGASRRKREQASRDAQREAQLPAAADFTEPEPGADAAAGCESGYDPCVPAFPPDVDCADVSGPIAVTGSDPHGLDRDRDGVGCEAG